MNWRHRVALIEQWNRANLALTARLLEFMYGPSFPELKICEFLQLLFLSVFSSSVAKYVNELSLWKKEASVF
jgi:hypothetical protein